MRLLLSALFLLFVKAAIGQSYSSDLIDEGLKKNANAVVRKDHVVYEIQNEGKAKLRHEFVVTILNSSGRIYTSRAIPYMAGDDVHSIQGTLYDARGKKVKTLKKSQIEDMSADRSSFFSDARVKVFELKHNQYPYTVEFTYEHQFNGLLFYEDFWFQTSPNAAVEFSVFDVLVPEDLELRYKEVNLTTSVQVLEEKGMKKYTWTAENIKAFKPEELMKNSAEQLPRVILGPTRFVMGGYAGDMSTWEGLSTWYYHLNRNRNQLTDETKDEIAKMVEGTDDKAEKVKRVYEFMQNRTRYVSLQLGIGGWQTLEAMHVDQLGWGDCKALTNYTKALLEVVGIPSHEALVRAGSDAAPIYDDFPSSQFNHVILSVPMEHDTIWLECTSQTAPFNHLGSFTGNRKVLLVKKKGGKLVNSMTYRAEDNLELTSSRIKILETGDAEAKISRSLSGSLMTKYSLDLYRSYSPQDQEQLLYKVMDLSDYSIRDFEIGRTENGKETELNVTATLNKYVTQTGKRLFLPLNAFVNTMKLPKPDNDRKSTLYLESSFTEIDTINYELPKDYYNEYLPESISIEKLFGKYSIDVFREGNEIRFVRKLIIYEGEYPAALFEEYRDFVRSVKKNDKIKIVLQKKT